MVNFQCLLYIFIKINLLQNNTLTQKSSNEFFSPQSNTYLLSSQQLNPQNPQNLNFSSQNTKFNPLNKNQQFTKVLQTTQNQKPHHLLKIKTFFLLHYPYRDFDREKQHISPFPFFPFPPKQDSRRGPVSSARSRKKVSCFSCSPGKQDKITLD